MIDDDETDWKIVAIDAGHRAREIPKRVASRRDHPAVG